MSDELSRTCRTCGYALLTPNYPSDAACAMCAIDNASKEGPCCGYGDIDMDNFGNVDCCDKWEPRKSHIAVTDEQLPLAVHDGRAWQVVRTCRNIGFETGDDFKCSACGEAYNESDDMAMPASRIDWCFSCGARVVR